MSQKKQIKEERDNAQTHRLDRVTKEKRSPWEFAEKITLEELKRTMALVLVS